MTLRDAIAGIILLILVYLIVFNGAKTREIISALGESLTAETKALQGR